MAGKILEIIEKTISPEEKDEKIRDNFIQLGKQQYLQGAQLLVDTVNTVSQSVTATSYTELSQFKAGVVSSGGVLIISANLRIETNNNTASVGIFIDDSSEAVEQMAVGYSAVAGAQSMRIEKAVKLGEGQHVIRLKGKVNGGTGVFGGTGSDTSKGSFQVLEILGG